MDVVIYGAPHTAAVYFQRGESVADVSIQVNKTAAGALAKTTDWQYLEGLDIPDGETVTLTFTATAASSITIKYLGASL